MAKTRLDKIKLDNIEVTSQGFLRFPVYAGRTGIQIYQNEDGSIRKEYRPPEEVFSEVTLDSIRNIPVTNEHPEEMVDLNNVKDLMVGMGSDIVAVVNEDGEIVGSTDARDIMIDGKFQKTFVTITDVKSIADIQEGKVEVSLGYDVELDETPGTAPDGQSFDAIQRNILNNHLALTDKGRAGPEVRLRFDRFDAIMIDESDKPKPSEDNMAKLKIGDKEFEMEQEAKDAIEGEMKSLKEKGDEAEEKAKEEKDGLEKAKDEAEEKEKEAKDGLEEEKEKNDSLQAKFDALKEKKSKVKLDAKEIQTLVKERKDLEEVATKTLDEDTLTKLDSMSDSDIKKAVITQSTKAEIKLDEKSSVYIDARFDAIKENLDTSSNANSDASKEFSNAAGRQDTKQPNWRVKRDESMKNDSEAWTKPIGKSSTN